MTLDVQTGWNFDGRNHPQVAVQFLPFKDNFTRVIRSFISNTAKCAGVFRNGEFHLQGPFFFEAGRYFDQKMENILKLCSPTSQQGCFVEFCCMHLETVSETWLGSKSWSDLVKNLLRPAQ